MTPSEIAALEWFKQAWPGPLARTSTWLFGFAETLHFMGLCLLFGSLLLVDLRLIGLFKRIPVKEVMGFLPYALVGFAILAATGWVFFTSNPAAYYGNPAFRAKMIVIVLAGINAAAFTLIDHEKLAAIGPGEAGPAMTRVMGSLSLGLWLTALLLGRLLPVFVASEN